MSEIREQARWLSGELRAGRDAIKALSKPQLGNSSIESGKVEEYDTDGTLVSVVGEQFDGTHAAVTVAGPPPPEPVPPTVTTGINSAEVRWNGKFVDDAVSPMDFSHVTVHASQLESFDPDNTTQRATITGESGDTATLALDSGQWYFLLVAVSKAGKWSTPSDIVSGEVDDFLQDAVTDSLIDLSDKYDGVFETAGQLDGRLQLAESDLSTSKGRLDDAEGQLTAAFGQISSAISQAVNAVPDPGFENGGAGWIPDNAAVTFPTVTGAHGGSKVMQIVAPSSATTVGPNANLFTTVTPGDVWQVAAWVRVEGTLPTAGDIRLAPITQTATGTRSYPTVVTLPAASMTNNWQLIKGTYTIPAGVTSLCFRVRGDAALNGGTVIWIDDVDMRDVSGVTAALTMAGTKSTVFYSLAPASGKGNNAGDLWRQRDANNAIIAEWQWSDDATPKWVKQTVSGSNVSNMDIGYLTAGAATMSQALINTLVAATANFQRADIKNLFSTNATLDSAVIKQLWTDVVNSQKITAQMIAVGDFTNLIPDAGFLRPEVTAMRDAQFTNGGKAAVNAAGDMVLTLTSTGSSYFRPTGINQSATTYKDWIPVQPGDKYLLAANITLPAGGTGDIRLSGRTKDGQATVTVTGAPTLVSGNNTYVATIPATCYWVLPEIRFSGATGTATITANSLMLRKQVNAITLEDGAVTADKLVSKLVLTSEVIAGNPDGNHAKMTPTGFKVMAVQDGGGAPTEAVSFGTSSNDYLNILDSTGETLASISATGAMSATGLNVGPYDELTNTGGLSIDGTPLDDMLSDRPKGLVAWASRGSDGLYYAGTTPHPYLSLQVDSIKAGRAYMVSTSPIGMTSDTANSDARVNLHYQSGADRPATVSDPIIAAASSVPSSWSTGTRNPATINRLVTPTIDGTMSLLLSYGVESTGRAKITVGGGRSVFLTVQDMGVRVPETGEPRDGAANAPSGGSTGGETAPPTVSKKNYDKTYTATNIRSFRGDGTQYNFNAGYMYSGLSPAGYGDLSSMAVFPSFTGDITNGGTVTGVWVYVYYDFWYQGSGGTAYVGLHGQTGLTSTKPAYTYNWATSPGWPRAAGRWIKLSSSTWDGFRTGQHRGITLGGHGGGYSEYGYAHSPKIRITWTK